MGKDKFTSEWFDTVAELIKNHELEQLDIIAFERTGLVSYHHYAVVLFPLTEPDGTVTDYDCIHVTTPGGQSSTTFSASSAPEAQVRIQKLSDIAADGALKPSRVRIHNQNGRKDIGAKERIDYAYKMVDKKFSYELLWSNCEHFSNQLRSDFKESQQVIEFLSSCTILGIRCISYTIKCVQDVRKNIKL